MKAAQINNYGDVNVININEIDKPKLSDGQALIEVYASSLNPFDTAIRSGAYKDMIKLGLPVTIGGDVAGLVTEVGSDVVTVKVGDKVYGQANAVAGNSGAFAEYAATSEGQITKFPSKLTFEQAASLPLVGVSALQAISEHINLRAGQKLFINGGSGGIGSIAIQIAKNIGAYVAVTAPAEFAEYVKDLGADEVIDYKSQDFTEIIKDYDAVFDTVGGDDFNKSFSVLKNGGIAVSMIAPADESMAKDHGVTAITQATQVTTQRLDQLSRLIESGIVTPQINAIYTLEQIKDAFLARESGGNKGKIVISIKK